MCNGIVKLVYVLVGSRKIVVHESNEYCVISEGFESREYQTAVMHHVTMGIHSEKRIIRGFNLCANVV
jgi:hypothetical protein